MTHCPHTLPAAPAARCTHGQRDSGSCVTLLRGSAGYLLCNRTTTHLTRVSTQRSRRTATELTHALPLLSPLRGSSCNCRPTTVDTLRWKLRRWGIPRTVQARPKADGEAQLQVRPKAVAFRVLPRRTVLRMVHFTQSGCLNVTVRNYSKLAGAADFLRRLEQAEARDACLESPALKEPKLTVQMKEPKVWEQQQQQQHSPHWFVATEVPNAATDAADSAEGGTRGRAWRWPSSPLLRRGTCGKTL